MNTKRLRVKRKTKPPYPQQLLQPARTAFVGFSHEMEKTGLPVLPSVDSDRDAKAVIRRMRMQGRQPDATLNIQTFHQLIVAAKDDVVADDAAAKDELSYYRNLLDVVKDKPLLRRPPTRTTLTPPDMTSSTVKLPSLNKGLKDTRTGCTNTSNGTPSLLALQSNQLDRPPTRSKADKSQSRETHSAISNAPFIRDTALKPPSPGGAQFTRASVTRPVRKQPAKLVKAPGSISADDSPQHESLKESSQSTKGSKRQSRRDPSNNRVPDAHEASDSSIRRALNAMAGRVGTNNPPPKDEPMPGDSNAATVLKPIDTASEKKSLRRKKAVKAGAVADNQQLEAPSAIPSSSLSFKKPPRDISTSPALAKSALDCVDSFDDDEPEIDTAPVWRDDMMTMDNGYGSDDDGM
ncbi:hypothetical protein H310_00049 [Aphanomyces invadans]|uniref:Uncharacterized protein n=1 Tax=Aphanomyces invadans TaxID=157072 RepID=A0A024UV08_9STRA|nr:hypothetical protein H310_00049 [Aphanomyces invadans]ETW09458.1 hypothetical protein H310_00049 [Aphanomyces invadans]|eukprot:XP_008860869.1 hypothetical protein H310_00049 [Aphanomyces invadans]